jgi:predicted lipid-binding transport protein (Tim44 family)
MFFFDLLFFCAIASFLAYKLYKLLGTTDEESIEQAMQQAMKNAKLIEIVAEESNLAKEIQPVVISEEAKKFSEAMQKINEKDSNFTEANFLESAKKAYEMIIEAFTKQKTDILKVLVSEKVYEEFSKEMERRKEAGENWEYVLVSFDKASLADVKLKGSVASVKVYFETNQINYAKNKEDNLVMGSMSNVDKIIDYWRFEKDLDLEDVNWKLVATAH